MAATRSYSLAFSALVGTAAMQPHAAHALVSESVCSQVRTLTKSENTPWFGLDAGGRLTPLKPSANVSPRAAAKVIYLATRDGQAGDRTVVGVKIKFTPETNYNNRNSVAVQNNFQTQSFSVGFDDYQPFHRDGKAHRRLRANFHLSTGVFNREIPFLTYAPDERRRQMAFRPATGGEDASYRAYLITFQGIRRDGSCVDFAPYYPPGAKSVDFDVVDLLEDRNSRQYYFATTRIGLSE